MPSNAIQSYAGRLNKKDKVMTLTALSGEFPYSEFERLNISSSYGKLIRHNFYNDGLMKRTYSKNGLKGIRLTNRGKERLKQKFPERFGHIADKNRTETSRRYRRQLFAKTYCSLLNADIEFLPDKKPFIFARRHSQSYEVVYPLLKISRLSDMPVFYDSMDIKYELEDFVQQIRNSVMTGLILTDSKCLVLYNIDENRYPLSYGTALRVSCMIDNGTFLNIKNTSNAIFLVSDFDIAADLIFGNKDKDVYSCTVILNEVFRHIYIVPENPDGDVQLRVLCHQELSEMIEDTFIDGFGYGDNGFKTVNDGFDKYGNPVLNGCHLDIIRLMKFKRGLLNNDISGRILCYDFQVDFVQKIMCPAKVKINNIKIHDVREMIENEKS